MHSARFLKIVLFFAIAVSPGCGEGSGDDISGPCYDETDGPVLKITSATDPAGNPIPVVELSELKLQGNPFSLSLYLNLAEVEPSAGEETDAGEASNSTEGKVYECEIPCGFGTASGTYEFIATAPGLEPMGVQADAEYGEIRSGCPSYRGDGTTTELSFE